MYPPFFRIPMQFSFSIMGWLAVWLGFNLLGPSPIPKFADELPDHFAEKSLGVTLRDRSVYLEYRVGMSARELRNQCQSWEIDVAVEATDSELMKTFAKGLSDRIGELVTLQIDGETVKPEIVETRAGGQHHVSAVIQLKYTVPETKNDFDLFVHDQSFLELDGAIRVACKGLGTAMLRNSNVQSLVVRAKRVILTELDEDQRRANSSIKARVLISEKSSPK